MSGGNAMRILTNKSFSGLNSAIPAFSDVQCLPREETKLSVKLSGIVNQNFVNNHLMQISNYYKKGNTSLLEILCVKRKFSSNWFILVSVT